MMKNKYIRKEDNWKPRYCIVKDGYLAWYNDIIQEKPLGYVIVRARSAEIATW